MKWSKFTYQYFPLFESLTKLDKTNNNISYLLKKEKKNIIKYIVYHFDLKIIIKLLSNQDIDQDKLKKQIIDYSKSDFVDTKNLIKKLDTLNKTYIILWNNNKIIIKSDTYPKLLKRIEILILIIEYIKEKIKLTKTKPITIYLILSRLICIFLNKLIKV